MKNVLSLKDYFTSSGRFPERSLSTEITLDVENNAKDLLDRVNGLLYDLLIDRASLSSGFRPSDINASIENAAKKSAHTSGKALDIVDDKNQTLANLILSRPDLLKKWGLMIEHPSCTKGKNTNWVHLDTVVRSYRASYSFKV